MIDFFKGTVTPKDMAIVAGIAAVAATLCALFFFFVYVPQTEKLTAANAKLTQVRAELRRAQEIADNIEQLRKDAAKWQELVDTFENRLPTAREIPRMLQQFESMGIQIGLRLKLEPLPVITDTSKETIPYAVTAQGDFHSIVNFINLLERDERYLKISDLDIQKEEAGISEAKFTMSTFRFIQAAPSPVQAPRGAQPKGAER